MLDEDEPSAEDAPERAAGQTEFEFYFEEGFTGEPFVISTSSGRRLTLEPKTRFQIGLAAVERMELPDGDEVTIESDALGLHVALQVDADKKFVRVTRTERGLQVSATERQPGYV